MEKRNAHGSYIRPGTSAAAVSYGASDLDGGSSQYARLRKHKSNTGVRSASHGQPMSGADQIMRGNGTAGTTRKGSIRDVVKKIFRRRSRDVESEDTRTYASASRHVYHKSEPMALSPPREDPEPVFPVNAMVEPNLADQYTVPTPSFNRSGSQYAVQFPNSVRLKPMDLGTPLITSSSKLRRRKTLPSLVVAERDAAALAAATSRKSTETKRSPDIDFARALPSSSSHFTASQTKSKRRKSRSAEDLMKAAAAEPAPKRKRSEEIRYWRESFQPDVLRASGFTAKTPTQGEKTAGRAAGPMRTSPRDAMLASREASKVVPSQSKDAFRTTGVSSPGTTRSSPPARHEHRHEASIGESDMRPSTGVDTEMSKDLEDRVAKLEAGLHTFQRSLQRLTADRNRRTVIMGNPTTHRSSTDMRSPSALADTLADPLEPSSYRYEYEQTSLRPSRSLQPPSRSPPPPPKRSPPPPLPSIQTAKATLEDPFGPDPPVASDSPQLPEPLDLPSPLRSHPPMQQFPSPPPATAPAATLPPAPAPARALVSASSSSPNVPRNQPQQYTFSSLYKMLADERSARRKLESQLQSLKQELTDLHIQVNSVSTIQSARSSYMLSGTSTRLQELLQDTESSPSNTAPQSPQRDSGMMYQSHQQQQQEEEEQPVTSRFSGSEMESDAGAPATTEDYDELSTPHEAYQTPREARSLYSLASTRDSDMF